MYQDSIYTPINSSLGDVWIEFPSTSAETVFLVDDLSIHKGIRSDEEILNDYAEYRPVAYFEIFPEEPTTADIIVFNASMSFGGKKQPNIHENRDTYSVYDWSFQDPTHCDMISILSTIEHRYVQPGWYEVSLWVEDWNGFTASFSRQIYVAQGIYDHEDDYEDNDNSNEAKELAMGFHSDLYCNDYDYFYIANIKQGITYYVDLHYDDDSYLHFQYMTPHDSGVQYSKSTSFGQTFYWTADKDYSKLKFLIYGNPNTEYALEIYAGENPNSDDSAEDDVNEDGGTNVFEEIYNVSIPGLLPIKIMLISFTSVGITIFNYHRNSRKK
jgi:hypothetical protein